MIPGMINNAIQTSVNTLVMIFAINVLNVVFRSIIQSLKATSLLSNSLSDIFTNHILNQAENNDNIILKIPAINCISAVIVF
jgi:hypothetical protein